MAVGWIGLLKSVPWSEVVSNAPKIAGGARSLWNSVTKKIRPDEVATTAGADRPPETSLTARIGALETRQAELQQQLASASALIDSLAEQNTQLVARLDALRGRLRWIIFGMLALGALAAAVLLKII